MRGLAHVAALPKANEAFLKLSEDIQRRITKTDPPIDEAKLEEDQLLGEFAQEEFQKGFPSLVALFLVSDWGSLEVFVRDFQIAWLRNYPQAIKAPEFQRVRIRLAEYQPLSEYEKFEYLLTRIENEIKSSERIGIGKFECIHKILGLGGPIDEVDKRLLLEMPELRHVLVHRRGIADEQLSNRCPSLDVQIGEPVIVSFRTYVNYVGASARYWVNILQRSLRKLGLPSTKEEAENWPIKGAS